MKINIHRNPALKKQTLEDFADKHNLEMDVFERKANNLPKFYAHFRHVETREKGFSVGVGAYGDGETPKQAIKNYAKRISGHVLIVNAFSNKRQEIQAPKFI